MGPHHKTLTLTLWTIGAALIALPGVALLAGGAGALPAMTLWFCASLGTALIAAGYFTSEGARAYALVLASLFIGGAAQLWLTQPLWFPALRFGLRGGGDAIMAALVAAQAALAIAVLWRRGAIRRPGALFSVFGPLRILLFLALSAAFSVSVMGYLPRGYLVSWGMHMVAGGALVGVNLLSVAALLSLPPPFTRHRGFHPVIPAFVAFAASAALAWFGFDRLPHVEDELVYLFQAQTLAHGSFSAPAPPQALWPGLEFYLLEIRDGRWFATTPPGWPAVLSLGVRAGAPWLVNPVLAGLAVLFAHGVARRLASRNQADIVALLMATSPWFLGASASLMAHTLTITLMLAAWWLLLLKVKTRQRQAAVWLLAGLAMGWVFATRQLDGVLVGTLTGLWLVSRWREPGGGLRVVIYSLGAILAGSFYFVHNVAMTGQLLTSPLARYISQSWGSGGNAYGFGAGIGPPGGWGDLDMAPGHSPFEGLLNTMNNLSALQLELFGWGIGSLALVWGLLLWGRPNRADRAMLALVLTVVGAMFLYWFAGSFYIGPRYWFAAFFALLFLSASGYRAVAGRLMRLGVHGYSSGITLFMLAVFGLSVFTPWRGVAKYHGFGNVTADLRQAAERGDFGNGVVFFDLQADVASALMLNDPWLSPGAPVFLRDMGPEANARAAAALAGRKVYSYTDKPAR